MYGRASSSCCPSCPAPGTPARPLPPASAPHLAGGGVDHQVPLAGLADNGLVGVALAAKAVVVHAGHGLALHAGRRVHPRGEGWRVAVRQQRSRHHCRGCTWGADQGSGLPPVGGLPSDRAAVPAGLPATQPAPHLPTDQFEPPHAGGAATGEVLVVGASNAAGNSIAAVLGAALQRSPGVAVGGRGKFVLVDSSWLALHPRRKKLGNQARSADGLRRKSATQAAYRCAC